MSYTDDLQDERWYRRRREVVERGGNRCANCGRTDHLEVHHEAYIPGRRAWEYGDDLLVCLCDECHANRQIDEDQIRVTVGRYTRHLSNAAIHGLRRTIIGKFKPPRQTPTAEYEFWWSKTSNQK